MAEAHHHGAIYYQNPWFHWFVKNTGTVPVTVPFTIQQDGKDGYASTFTVQPGQYLENFAYPWGGALPDAPAGVHSYTITLDPQHTIQTTHPTTNDFVALVDVPTSAQTWDFTGNNATIPNLVFNAEGCHLHGPFVHYFLIHFQAINNNPNKGAASSACHWSVQRNGVPITPMNLTKTGPADFTIPALAPGQSAPDSFGAWDDSQFSGSAVFTITLDPMHESLEAYSSDKTRSYTVVFGLNNTGQPAGTP
jgi:hypothetical protein